MKKSHLFLIVFSCLILSSINIFSQDKIYSNEFPLGDVQLLDGPFKDARDLNIEVLLKYDVDRLLAPYRKEAGLSKKAESFAISGGNGSNK